MSFIIKLVKKAQKGDDTAFMKLFEIYEKDIYRTAYLYVKNQNDALDVVQETAYKAFKNIKGLKNPEYFKTWLTKIAISCSIDLVRKNKKVIHLPIESILIEEKDDSDIPLSISLKDIMNVLTEKEKQIVLLKYYWDYTFHEIAEMEKTPLGTVKSVLYRALEKLRKQADRSWYG